uniref:Forkhead box protein M1 n=1 Tax=Ciona savignyi TaxID=51511 RepID=H2YS14_CIOSA
KERNSKSNVKPKACRPIILQRKHTVLNNSASVKQSDGYISRRKSNVFEEGANTICGIEQINQNTNNNASVKQSIVKYEQSELSASQPWCPTHNETGSQAPQIKNETEHINLIQEQCNVVASSCKQSILQGPQNSTNNIMTKQEPGFSNNFSTQTLPFHIQGMKPMFQNIPVQGFQLRGLNSNNQSAVQEVPVQNHFQMHGNTEHYSYQHYEAASDIQHSYNNIQVPGYYQQPIQPSSMHSGHLVAQPRQDHFQNTMSVGMTPNTHYQVHGFRTPGKFHDQAVDDSLTNITWLGRMGVNNFMPVPLERERKVFERDEKRGRPPYSYMALIQFAINSSSAGRMTLRQIYQWIEEKFPYFISAKPGWKNSIRHNLSLHDIFVRQVTTGSKASYWTLRSDLNIRPLTLDSVRGTSQHSFQESPNNHETTWSLQTVAQGQKPILPRLPPRPYILLPVPLINNETNEKEFSPNVQTSTFFNSTPISSQYGDRENRRSSSQECSLLADSGFVSDISVFTPSTHGRNFLGCLISRLERQFLNSDCSPMLSQTRVTSGTKRSTKKSRKEPLKTLHDSFNSSVNFEKNEVAAQSKYPSSPSSASQLLHCKPSYKKDKHKSPKLMTEESFNEILEDLGSPFKSCLARGPDVDSMMSPRSDPASRKRRCSWGSPESSKEFQHRSKTEREVTPSSRCIRRVKSCVGDLRQNYADMQQKNLTQLPTSTPLNKNKWQKTKRCNDMDLEDSKENMLQCFQNTTKQRDDQWCNDKSDEIGEHSIPSPIPSSSKNPAFDFFHDLIGSVFKTPDKPSHFESLTPERVPLADITHQHKDTNDINVESSAVSESIAPPNPSLLSPKYEPLDTSFSKLLDISGGSGTFSRHNQFSDVPDLSLSWSNFSHF